MKENQFDKKPTVSVVMPIFCHSAEQLTLAINSILKQTFQDLELIVVDGRADDGNFKIISSFEDPRLKYFKTKGYVNCLNLGLDKSQGKYIARMDSDDISYPTRIEEQVRFLDENPSVSLCSCLVELFGDERPLKCSKHTADVNLINIIESCEFVHTAMMFRKEINLRYDYIKPLEDCLLFRKLLLAGHQFEIIDKFLMKSYQSNGSIMCRHPKYITYMLSKINTYALVKYFHTPLSFTDEIFTKKHFSKQDIIEFLEVVLSLKEKLKPYKKKAVNLFFPYFLIMMAHSSHKWFLLKTKVFYQTFFKKVRNKVCKHIFSITNEYTDGVKIKKNKKKVICLLGFKYKFYAHKRG